MRNVLLCLFTFVAIGTWTPDSYADVYISGSLGAVVVNDSDTDDGDDTGEFTFDSGTGYVVALGAANEAGRVEMEYGYRENDFDELKGLGPGSRDVDGDINSTSLMLNIYYDFLTKSGFYPFFGVGVGAASVEADIDNTGDEDDTVFAYQVMLGGSYTTSIGLSIDLQYRYFATDDPDFDGIDAEYRTHNLMIGLRQSF